MPDVGHFVLHKSIIMMKTLIALAFLILAPLTAWAGLATRATLPTAYVTDTENPPSSFAITKTVCASTCDYTTIQAAVNYALAQNSASNIKISVTAGYTTTECINLSSSNSTAARTNTGWIYITSSAEASLPPRGVRIGCRVGVGCTDAQKTADIANMYHVAWCATSNFPVIYSGWDATNNGVEYFWFRGLDIQPTTGDITNAAVISLSTNVANEPTLLSQEANHMIFEQIHVEQVAGTTAAFSRGCWCNGHYIAIVDSVIGRFTNRSADSQTIIMTRGGPLRARNNDLFSATEVTAIGDSNPSLPVVDDPNDNKPHDIEWQYNMIGVKLRDLNCPGSVVAGTTRYANLPDTTWLKNLYEHKQVNRTLINGNYFYNYQNGFDQHWAMAFQAGNPDASIGAPNGISVDVTYTNNLLYGFSAWVQMLGSDHQVTSPKETRVTVENNAFIDERRSAWALTYNGCADAGGSGSNHFYVHNEHYPKSYSGSNGLSTSGAGATTVTAASPGFPQFWWNMAGQTLTIASGTNFVAGTYTISSVVDDFHITVTASPTPAGAGSSGVGSIDQHTSLGGPDHLLLNHNTWYKLEGVDSFGGTGYLIQYNLTGWTAGASLQYLDFTNNITSVGNRGFSDNTNYCTSMLETAYPNAGAAYNAQGNIFVVDAAQTVILPGSPCNTASRGTFSGNYYPDSWASVGFGYVPPDASQIDSTFNLTPKASCAANADVYPMTMTSGGLSAAGCGTDGKNPGADMNVLLHEVNFAIKGTQPSAVTGIAATTGAGLSATASNGGSGYAPNLLAH